MPSTVYIAAVDLGATSGRVILGTWSRNQLKLTEVHRFPNAFRTVGTNDYWDIPGLWHQVQTGLRKVATALPKGAKLASVGVDTWGVDYVLVNDLGRPVFPVHAYRDVRTQRGVQRLENTRAAAERIYAATGLPNFFLNSSLQLAETVENCPAITDLATRCLFLPDYFNFLLSGKMANELTISSTSQLMDVNRPDWSRVALDYFRVPSQWFTKPVPPGTKLGSLQGFPELKGAKVIAVPGHDTACAYDAMPAAEDGNDLYISSGTWSLVGFESTKPVLGSDPALSRRVSNQRIDAGRYCPLSNVIGLWLLEGVLKDFASRPENDKQWAALITAAEKLPAPKRLIDIKDHALENPASMRAAIDAQLRKAKVKPPTNLAGYVRLICDSLGRGHADAMKAFERLSGRTFKRILIVGGGSKNRLLCQATADAAGVPVVSFNLEGTAVGNMASQLISLGEVKDLRTFRRLLSASLEQKTYKPRPVR